MNGRGLGNFGGNPSHAHRLPGATGDQALPPVGFGEKIIQMDCGYTISEIGHSWPHAASSPMKKIASTTTKSETRDTPQPVEANKRTKLDRSHLHGTAHHSIGNHAVQSLYDRDNRQETIAVSKRGDPAEHEAERVAEQVMRHHSNIEPTESKSTANYHTPVIRPTSRLQQGSRKTIDQSESSKIHEILSAPGKSLPSTVRSDVEPIFGSDFSEVRIHTNKTATAAAQAINARAFTVGNNIAFNAGEYHPNTPTGKRLLAHELAHVQQQHDTPTSQVALYRQEALSSRQTVVPVEERDNVCEEISEEDRDRLASRITRILTRVRSFRDWLDGEGWDAGAGNSIPSLFGVNQTIGLIRDAEYVCAENSIVGVPGTDPLIRDYLYSGVGTEDGLQDVTPSSASGGPVNGLDILHYWTSYAGAQAMPGNIDNVTDYFAFTPIQLINNYGMRVDFGIEYSGGAGLGGKLDAPFGSAAIGCYVLGSISGEIVMFSYSNNLGMRWTQYYAAGEPGLGLECSLEVSVGPSAETSFGNDDFCSGNTSSYYYYGPGELTGVRFDFTLVSLSSTAGLGVEGGKGELIIYNPGSLRDPLQFDTTGPCFQLMAGIGKSASFSDINLGAQGPVLRPTQEHDPLKNILSHQPRGLYELIPADQQAVFRRDVYFDTGSRDPLSGESIGTNTSALHEVLYELMRLGNHYPPESIAVSFTGHASPRWRGADSFAEAVQKNEALAGDRALQTRQVFIDHYYQAMESTEWPDPRTILEPVNIIDPEDLETAESRGATEGFAETGDPDSNDPQYRRVTIEILVQYYSEERRNLLEIPDDAYDLPEAENEGGGGPNLPI